MTREFHAKAIGMIINYQAHFYTVIPVSYGGWLVYFRMRALIRTCAKLERNQSANYTKSKTTQSEVVLLHA